MTLDKELTYKILLQNSKIRRLGYQFSVVSNWNCCICGKHIYSKYLPYDSPSLIYCDECYEQNIRIYKKNKITKPGVADKHLVLNPFQTNQIMKLRQYQYKIINKHGNI
jgi:ribosome-binding protein aMBF1 (putative translation factor)